MSKVLKSDMLLGKRLLRTLTSAGEIGTIQGRALVEERYSSLKRQIPIVYLLAAVNLFGLQLALRGQVTLGFNLPSAVSLLAVMRIRQWLRRDEDLSHATMLRRLNQTACLAAILCIAECCWCVFVLGIGTQTQQMAIMLLGGLTAIGVAFGLSSHPAAARLPLVVLAIPLAIRAFMSTDPQFIGVAISLVIITVLVWRLLSTHEATFTDLIQFARTDSSRK